jgi:hypothetical protein
VKRTAAFWSTTEKKINSEEPVVAVVGLDEPVTNLPVQEALRAMLELVADRRGMTGIPCKVWINAVMGK